MTGLRLAIASARSEPYAAAPTLVFRIVVDEPAGALVQAALLQCQVYIDVRRRTYSALEGERLNEIVGERTRRNDTMRPLLWATAPVVLSRRQSSMAADVPISCGYDFELASAKYFRMLEDGEVPLLFMFSGTIFRAGTSALQVSQLPWDTETRFRLPVRTWREAMEQHFGDSAWFRLSRSGFDALDRVRRRRGCSTWDQLVEALCAEGAEAEAGLQNRRDRL
jgi:Family of unknown function (DUF6084)